MVKNVKKFSVVMVILILMTSISPYAAATVLEPRAVPTISSTKCSQCSTQMDFVLTEKDYQDVLVQPQNCPNTKFWADGAIPHTHTYELLYDVYMCPTCGRWGQMLVSRTMKYCEITRPDGKMMVYR